MKAISAIFFLSSGFFAVAFFIMQIGGLTQNVVSLAITSLIFGVLAYVVATTYLRRKRFSNQA